MRRSFALDALVALVACASCSGTKADAGQDAWLRIEGAQFFRGAAPDDAGGPLVSVVNIGTNTIRPGTIDKPVNGALAADATAAAISIAGDRGYWIVPSGLPDVQAPGFPTFKASLQFAAALPSGRYDLVVRAVDAAGRFGPPSARPLTTLDQGPPDGKLVVALSWDTESDLDLHVVDATGAEIWKGNINSYKPPPPGSPQDPDGWKTGGILDFDSNAACVIDGRRRENVVWKTAPPSGHYVVRVDTASLCGEVSAHWTAEAFLGGSSLGRSRGSSFDSDTQFSHDLGAGVLALELDIP